MSRSVALHVRTLFAALLLSSCLCAQDELRDIFQQAEERLWEGIDQGCEQALLLLESSNALELFRASVDCQSHGTPIDQALLRALGQIRGGTDLELFKPADDFEEIVLAQFAIAMVYQFGELVDPKYFRDPAFVLTLQDQVNMWVPFLESDYHPGWNYRNEIDSQAYLETLDKLRNEYLADISLQAKILQNDRYFSAYEESREIMARNSGSLSPDDADYERYRQLSLVVADVASGIRAVASEAGDDRLMSEGGFEPHETDPFLQVYTGLNGPENYSTDTFFTPSDVRSSWVGEAIDSRQLEELLDRVDFSGQVLVAFASGFRGNTSGKIYITDASYNAILNNWSITGRVGVNQDGCGFTPEKQYPFAIAIAEKPGSLNYTPSSSLSNFPDRCHD